MVKPVILGPVHLHGLRRYLSLQDPETPFPSGMGGYCINALVEARLRRGWKTDVITLDTDIKNDITRMSGPLLRIWIVRRRKSKAVRDLFADERRRLMEAVTEANPDLLHANWTYEYGLTAARQSQYPYVVTVHDHARHCLRWQGWQYWPLYMMTQYVLRNSSHITTVSPYLKTYLEQQYRRPISMIPNLVSQTAWEVGAHRLMSPRTERSRINVVSAISWSSLKNAKNALAAFHIARQRCEHNVDLSYILMGPGMEPGGPAESFAINQHYAKGVIFKGVLPNEAALREIAGADVLFHPSHEEAMPGPVCEAMAMRVPVVACREAGGSRWLCGDGRGFLCNGHDPLNMAEQIITVCTGPQPTHCDAARDWLAGLTSEENVLDALNGAYSQVCNPMTPDAPSR
jgi:glycosyltransferase involved in cell wall biosynthesis